MKIKLLLLFCVLFLSSIGFAQTKQYLFVGKITDSIGPVKNANIVNLSTNQGTFSNDYGEYKIYASVGDSIQVSSVQHVKEINIITNFNLTDKVFDFYLEITNIVLDEIEVKKNNLNGFLALDRKKTPKDERAEALRKNLDFSKIDFSEKVKDDYIDSKVRPPITRTDPNMAFVGAGASAYFAFKHSEKLWRARRKVAFKQSFPEKLRHELGEKFFFTDLGIPKKLYYHFLDFCSSKNIEDLYLKNKVLDLVKILREESVLYLKVLKSETEKN